MTLKTIQGFNNHTNKISVIELQAYLDEHYSMHYLEDPATNLFTDLINFYGGDYIIFPGITDGGSYVLSHLLTAIYHWPDSGISNQFRSNCMHVSQLMLILSNNIADKLGYQRYIEGQVANNLIYIPKSSQLNLLKNSIVFSEDEMQEILLKHKIAPQALDCFIYDQNNHSLLKDHIQDSPLLKQPIIHHQKEYIIASPANISYALTQWILTEAESAGCQEEVSRAYHNTIWNYTKRDLSQLGFSRVEVSTLTGNNDQKMREEIYRFDDDKLALIQYVTEGTNHQERKKQIINDTLSLLEFAGYKFMDITLISTMGREFFFMLSRTENSKSITMPIYDFDTLVKLKEYSAFDLWKYITAKEKLGDNLPITTSFLDVFKVYKENDDSFYISDDIAQANLHIEPGYAEDLYQKAKLLTDEHSALRLREGGGLINIPVVRRDKYAPIYYSKSDLGRYLQFLITGYHQPFWVSPIKEIDSIPEAAKDLYFEMNEAIAYWLWQCQNLIKDDIGILGCSPLNVKFEFIQEERFHPIERNYKRDPDFINHFTVNATNHEISISIPPSIIPYLYGADNEGERALLRQLLYGFNQLLIKNCSPTIKEKRIDQIINEVAPLGAKKKIFILDTADNLLLDPSNLDKPRYIQDYDVNVILDSIVPGLGELCPEIGDITKKADKIELTKNIVVRFLLPKLQTTINQYDNYVLLNRLISLNESLINKREDLKIKTPTRIACFVSIEEQTEDLHNSLSKLNKTTIAVRCLIEHLAAEPSSGNKLVSTTAIDELIAIMSSIINWGSLGDQIKFDLFDIDMGILPSKRIGTSKKFSREIFDPYYSSKSKENVQNAMDTFEQVFPQLYPIEKKDVPQNFNTAFKEEFEISFIRICEFIDDLAIIAYKQPSACASLSKNDLFLQINQYDHVFTKEEFDHAMKYLCLVKRNSFHELPEGFNSTDISPWRFNRRLSLLRKPLVVVDNIKTPDNPTVYWGFRQLLISRLYLFDQCTTGRLRVTEGGPVQKVLGKLIQRNGSQLVQSVLEEVGSDKLIIDSEIPINPKSALKHDKDIGDIDVLVIDTSTKEIYSLECKSMAPSRNIKEMVEEVGKLFGTKSKKGWIKKHVERDTWLKNNLNLLGLKYKLDLSDFDVRSFIVTQEDMLTPHLTTRKPALPFVTLYNLREKGIDALR